MDARALEPAAGDVTTTVTIAFRKNPEAVEIVAL